MAGMVPRYTKQLVLLTTETDATLVSDLETIMKGSGEAVSRADVLRQALEPGLKRFAKAYAAELEALRASRK
jgi:hypothetical protein